MINEHLAHILSSVDDPSRPVEEADVLAVADEYPFFTLPAVMLLKSRGGELSPDVKSRLREIIALNAPDAGSLALLSDPAGEEWLKFYPSGQQPKLTTESVIDTFLETYGHSSPKEDALLERLIFNPTPDYSSLLAREEEMSLPDLSVPDDGSQDALINSFILSHRGLPAIPAEEEKKSVPAPPPAHKREQPAVQSADDNSSLSESLAKIYIRQKRFDKAFEIIHTLSLKNPKKSAYFADQLRYLRKLMLVRQAGEQ